MQLRNRAAIYARVTVLLLCKNGGANSVGYTSDSSAYVIMINDDNSMTTTQKRRIVQRSKLVDELWFLVKPMYNDYNMADFTVVLEYLMPVSKKYRNEFLTLADDTYQGYLKYTLPVNTKLTNEAGQIEIKVSFIYSDLDESGKSVQRVRKITSAFIDVIPSSAWSDVIPDCALSALDQRIIKLDAQIKALNETSSIISNAKADDLSYNENTNELQLMSGDTPIGSKVVLSAAYDEEGMPSVDFDKVAGGDNSEDEDNSNDVIEF